jgi:hypothetical protein
MDAMRQSVDTARSILASDRGRAARAAVAAGVIVAAPLVMRLPIVKRHPVGRLLAFAGGAAVLVRAAEAIRDWEPDVRPA